MWFQTRYSHWYYSSSCRIWYGTFKVGFQTDAHISSASLWLVESDDESASVWKPFKVVSETIPKPDEVVEFQKEVTFDKKDVIISRKILSIDTGKIAVILSYGFARMVAAESNSNLQNTFYQIQMTISNDLFMTLNSSGRNPDGFDSTIRT